MKTALLAGSTGLIGRELLSLLLNSPRYKNVIALARSSGTISHPKLSEVIVDLATLTEKLSPLKADDVFCCVGTTMAKARTEEKFREVDFHYPDRLATVTRANGSQQFLLVSSLGAKKDSSIFYNRVKGEVEEAVSRKGFPSVHIFRPSLLLGLRQERRSAEDAAKTFFRLFGFLVPRRYKPVGASVVAEAMLYYASLEEKGIFIHESSDIAEVKTLATKK